MDTRQDEPRSKEAPRAIGQVYTPSEDTFFLADYVEETINCSSALEVGVGSGYVTRVLASRSEYAVGTDISVEAVYSAKDYLRSGGVENVDLVVANQADPFRESSFQIVVSNPPYLPCEYEEEPLWCGGPRGIEFTLSLARTARSLLREGGRLVLMASSLSDVNTLVLQLKNLYSNVYVVQEKGVSLFEKLFILECEV